MLTAHLFPSSVQQKAEPILAYEAKGPVNQLQWSSVSPDWIAITYDDVLEILRV
jgi:WD repeat-containing protein 68